MELRDSEKFEFYFSASKFIVMNNPANIACFLNMSIFYDFFLLLRAIGKSIHIMAIAGIVKQQIGDDKTKNPNQFGGYLGAFSIQIYAKAKINLELPSYFFD